MSMAKQQALWRQRLAEACQEHTGRSGRDADPRSVCMLVAVESPGSQACGWISVGCVQVHEDGATPAAPAQSCEVSGLNVDPAAWGRGAATALLSAAVAHMRRRGFAHAVLWVMEGNARAIRFYQREGWQRDGARRSDKRDDQHFFTLRMRRAL